MVSFGLSLPKQFRPVAASWRRYYHLKAEKDATDADGWFNTGDIVTLDVEGYVRITDRQKDVIKSGGEWISSVDLENAAIGYSGVKIAAVIGVPDPKWEERPILIIEPYADAEVSREGALSHLATQVAKCWLPAYRAPSRNKSAGRERPADGCPKSNSHC